MRPDSPFVALPRPLACNPNSLPQNTPSAVPRTDPASILSSPVFFVSLRPAATSFDTQPLNYLALNLSSRADQIRPLPSQHSTFISVPGMKRANTRSPLCSCSSCWGLFFFRPIPSANLGRIQPFFVYRPRTLASANLGRIQPLFVYRPRPPIPTVLRFTCTHSFPYTSFSFSLIYSTCQLIF